MCLFKKITYDGSSLYPPRDHEMIVDTEKRIRNIIEVAVSP